MTPSRTRDHLRSNAVAYLALFFAITGTAAAITPQIQGDDIAAQAVGSRALRDSGIRKADIGTGAVGPAAVKDRSLTGVDIADGSLTGAQIDESTLDPNILQFRVSGDCPVGEAIRTVSADGSTTCESTGKGTLTGVTTSGGLTGGGTSGTVDVGVDPTQLQSRVSGNCSGNKAVQSVGQGGAVTCNPFVTEVDAGTGLTGGPITNSGSLSVDPTQVQSRVSGACGGTQAVQSVSQSGGVNCSSSLTPSSRVLASQETQINEGQTTTLLSTPSFTVTGDCTSTTDSRIKVTSVSETANLFWTVETGSTSTFTAQSTGANNPVTIGTTTGGQRVAFNFGVVSSHRTLSGSVAQFYFGSSSPKACLFIAEGVTN